MATVRTPSATATVITFLSAGAAVMAKVERETVNASGVTAADTTDSPRPQAAFTSTCSALVGLTEKATPAASAITSVYTRTGSGPPARPARSR